MITSRERLELLTPNGAFANNPAQQAIPLVAALCKALDAEGVIYCHWKSNAALDRSATADNDLDLLIHRADAARFAEILHQLGFKEARVPAKKQMPGILDYYGYDGEADRLVHVHAHYQLVLGDDMTKNYHLPIEEPYLESAIRDGLFRIPTPEFELIVLVIRMALKHFTWDAIISLQGRLPASARRELAYLEERADRARMHALLQAHLPYLDAELFERCLQSLRPGCPAWTRVRVGQELLRRLRAHARRPQAVDTFLKLWRRGMVVLRRVTLRRSPRKRMANGGAIVAVVGGDGSGKSTAVRELRAWLSRDFATIQLHLGKPPMSLATLAVTAAFKVSGWLGPLRVRPGKSPAKAGPDGSPAAFPGYLWLLRRVLVARDRWRTYIKARRFATNGGIAICDRYPVPHVQLMDGPQAARAVAGRRVNRLAKWLIQAEEGYYRQIMTPELLIVLKVNPDVAVQRRGDEDAAFVRKRCQEIWELDWQHTPARVIDAGRSRPEVVSELKAIVWSKL